MFVSDTYKNFLKSRLNIATRDYDTILDQIVSMIPEMTGGLWNDFSDGDPGFQLLSVLVGLVDMHNTQVDRLFMESFLATVTEVRNFIRQTSFSSYRYSGYKAGVVSVRMSPTVIDGVVSVVPSNFSIPKWTSFVINNVPFFAQRDLSVGDGITSSVLGYHYSPLFSGEGLVNVGDVYQGTLSDMEGNQSVVTAVAYQDGGSVRFTCTFSNHLYNLLASNVELFRVSTTYPESIPAIVRITLDENTVLYAYDFELAQGSVHYKTTNPTSVGELYTRYGLTLTFPIAVGKVAHSAGSGYCTDVVLFDGSNDLVLTQVDDVLFSVVEGTPVYQLVVRSSETTSVMLSPFFREHGLSESLQIKVTYVLTEGRDVLVASDSLVTDSSGVFGTFGVARTTSSIMGGHNPDTLEQAVQRYWYYLRTAGAMSTAADWRYRLSLQPYVEKVLVKDVEEASGTSVSVGGLTLGSTGYASIVPASPTIPPSVSDGVFYLFYNFISGHKMMGFVPSYKKATIVDVDIRLVLDLKMALLVQRYDELESVVRSAFFDRTNFGSGFNCTEFVSHLIRSGFGVVDWTITVGGVSGKNNLSVLDYDSIYLVNDVVLESA